MAEPTAVISHIYDVPQPTTDLLRLDAFADALQRLILQYLGRVEAATRAQREGADPSYWGPARHAFVVGIHGPWGCGKSTLMEMVGDRLSRGWHRVAAGSDRKPPITIRFQSWKFNQREELWRALLSRVAVTIEGEIDAELSEQARRGKEADPDRVGRLEGLRHECEVIKRTLYRDYQHTRTGEMHLKWGALPSLLVNLGISAWSLSPANMAKVGHDFFKIFEREKTEEFHDRLQELDQFQARFLRLREGLERPWLILIDDLDRCLPESAIEIFEATKVFLDAPGMVFVLALDKETIRRGLRVRYKEKEGEKPLVDPDLYIEKVTNISFVLPTLSEDRVRTLIEGLSANESRTDGGGHPRVKSLLGALLAHQQRHMQPNPRRWIRLLNTALLYFEMKDGLEPAAGAEAGAAAAAGDHELTHEDRVFLKLLCLSYRWGGFMEAALNAPEVLKTFEDAAFQAERDFERFKQLCRDRYPELRLYAEDAALFQLLLSEPALSDHGGRLVRELF